MALAALAPACADGDTGGGRAGSVSEPPRSVTVTATGLHRAHPDVAFVDLAIAQQSEAAHDAWTVAEDRLQDLEAVLEEAGVRRTDMQPRDYDVSERWLVRGGEQVRSYRATLALRATVREFARVRDVLAAAAELGVESIDGVRFGFADPAALRERAREQAIGAARARAQTLAEESQQRLGRVLSIVEDPGPPEVAGSVSGGPYEFAVTVTASYALSDS